MADTPEQVLTVCPHDCPDTCALTTEVRDGRAVRVSGAGRNALTNGWICVKVRPYLDWVYHPDRLLHPLRRDGPKGAGRWRRIGWDEALAEIAERWQTLIDDDGGAAILPYSYSGTLGLVQMSVASSRLFNRLGASGLARTICGAAGETAVRLTVGARWSPDPADLTHSRLIVLWGHNPASTAPHVMPLLRKARERGCRLVLIDPRRTLTAKSVDLHLQPRPASDGALALGLMHVLEREGLLAGSWIERHTLGYRDLQRRFASFTPDRVAEITGIEPEQIVELAQDYGRTRPSAIKIADGVQRHQNGGQTVRAIACLPALTGQYGVRGGGLFYSTSDTVVWDPEAVGKAADCPAPPRIVNMNRLGAALTGEVGDPAIRSLYVFGANPVASTPNASRIVEGLQRDDLFTVVHELFMTDTARHADIVLPATSQLEQVDLHKAYGHRLLQYNARAIEPRGEARSNWDTMRALAAALGLDDPWLREDADAVIDGVLTASAETQPALNAISLERLRGEGSVPLSLPADQVPFADGVFPTPSGKVELRSERAAAHGLDPLPDHAPPTEFAALSDPAPSAQRPLVLLTAASHHFVSSSLFPVADLRRRQGSSCLAIHPRDAEQRGIADGQLVRIHNARGSLTLPAKLSDEVRPGVVAAPKGDWPGLAADGRNVNWLTPDALGDLAGQSTFQSNLVWIEPAL